MQLDESNRCLIFGKPERPAVCGSLKPSLEMCGERSEHAMHYLSTLDALTAA